MRAFYLDAPILLFDEPTSALDAAAEAAFIRVLQALRDAGKTIIVAAHNAGLLAAADCVVQMNSGRIDFRILAGEPQPAVRVNSAA